MQADEAYDPDGPLLDLAAFSISAEKRQISEATKTLEERRAKLAWLHAQIAEMDTYILPKEKELEILRARNDLLCRLIAAARAAREGLKVEHDRALAKAAAAAARAGGSPSNE